MISRVSIVLMAFSLTMGFYMGAWAVPLPGEDRWPENLIVNGSFEDGPKIGSFLALDVDSTAIPGWVVTRGQIDLIGTHWKSADGMRSIDLHGSPGFGGIAQTFTTKKGRSYKVTFWLAGTPAALSGPGGVKRVAVRAADRSAAFSFDTTGKTGTDMGWIPVTWEFVANADKTTLEFHTLETVAPFHGPGLDNVSVFAN
jgi:choice-of-anchor C domain-containing protein